MSNQISYLFIRVLDVDGPDSKQGMNVVVDRAGTLNQAEVGIAQAVVDLSKDTGVDTDEILTVIMDCVENIKTGQGVGK